MATEYRSGKWTVRPAKRVHSFPLVLNARGDEIAAVYAGDECADYIRSLPERDAALKATLALLAPFAAQLNPAQVAELNDARRVAR